MRQSPISKRSLCGLVAGCWLLLFTTGCIRRSLTIRSEPPGAELRVNDKLLGTTPYAYDFMWYGWYRIKLTKPGYEQRDDRVLLRAPFYLWIPFDLVMELLPVPIHDTRALSYTLTPWQRLPEPAPPILPPPVEEEGPPATGGDDGTSG